MHVLVIGGTRFVGYYLVWRLLAAGHRVTIFSRGLLPNPFGERVEHLQGDRTGDDCARLLAGRRFDATVDFAAYLGPDVERLLQIAGERLGHYVLISSGQVYLVREGLEPPFAEDGYDGPVMPAPADARDLAEWEYGIGKRACEDALVAAADRIAATRLRLPMVNGERDYYRRTDSYLYRILDGGPVLLPDGGERRVRHVYGPAVARAIVDLLGNELTFGKAYNLCQHETPKLTALVALLADILGGEVSIAAIPSPDLEAAGLAPRDVSPYSNRWMSFLDPALAVAELDFQHEPLRQYLQTIVTCFLAHPPAAPPENYSNRSREVELANAIQNVPPLPLGESAGVRGTHP